MWLDHPFNQQNNATKRAVEVVVGGDRMGGGLPQFEKRGLAI